MTEELNKPEKTAYEQLKGARRKFVDFIVHGHNGTEAVRAISKKWTRPDIKASKWRKEPLVQRAIDECLAEAVKNAGVTHSKVLLQYNQFANGDSRACSWQAHETLPEGVTVGQRKKLHELDDVTARCVEVTVSGKDGTIDYRWPNRVQAGRLLGQALKMFVESHEINLGEKTLEQLLEGSWNRPRPPKPPDDGAPPAAGL